MIEIHTTCKDEIETKNISKILLENNLVACINYYPVKSMYNWKNKIVNDNEIWLKIKTTLKNKDKIIDIIKKNHSYELPAITIHVIEGTDETKRWIKDVCK